MGVGAGDSPASGGSGVFSEAPALRFFPWLANGLLIDGAEVIQLYCFLPDIPIDLIAVALLIFNWTSALRSLTGGGAFFFPLDILFFTAPNTGAEERSPLAAAGVNGPLDPDFIGVDGSLLLSLRLSSAWDENGWFNVRRFFSATRAARYF
jgi:hypothetical protein